MIEIVTKYFSLSTRQQELLRRYADLLLQWNSKINLVSRQDEQNIWERHILHSLSIAKVANFGKASIIDVGTGGGLPGLPLAIMFPGSRFTLIDSIGKKINALQAIIDRLELDNVRALHANSKQVTEKFDFVTARAVTDFRKFYKLTRHLLRKGSEAANIANGILYLKGGDFDEEIAPFGQRVKVYEISQWFDEPFFETKKIIYLQY